MKLYYLSVFLILVNVLLVSSQGCWTWIEGFDEAPTPGVQGKKNNYPSYRINNCCLGVPGDNVYPGVRWNHAIWVDNNGTIFVFAGTGKFY